MKRLIEKNLIFAGLNLGVSFFICLGNLYNIPQFISLYRQEMNIDFFCYFLPNLYTNSERNRWRWDFVAEKVRDSKFISDYRIA